MYSQKESDGEYQVAIGMNNDIIFNKHRCYFSRRPQKIHGILSLFWMLSVNSVIWLQGVYRWPVIFLVGSTVTMIATSGTVKTLILTIVSCIKYHNAIKDHLFDFLNAKQGPIEILMSRKN